MRIALDHAHIFSTDIAATLAFFRTTLDSVVVRDEEAPDDLLIELFECREPARWGIPT